MSHASQSLPSLPRKKQSIEQTPEQLAATRAEALLAEQTRLLEFIAEGGSLETCLPALTASIGRLRPGARAAVLLADEARKHMGEAFSSEIPASFGQQIRGVPIDELMIGTCGTAIYEGKPTICADVAGDERWSKPWRDLCVAHGIRSGFSTPIFDAEGQAIASFFICLGEAGKPDEWERSLGRMGASLAGIVIANARVEKSLQARLTDLELLQRISGELIHEENVQAMYEKILNAAVAIMHSDFASMQMLYPERGNGGELRLLAARGFSPEAAKVWEWVQADSETSCGVAFSSGRRVVVADIEQCDFTAGTEEVLNYRQAGIRAMQSTPLVSRSGKLLGMISTHWREPHSPSESCLRQCDILARQAADLIEHKQAEEKLRQELKLRRKTEVLMAGEKRVLELIASAAPLSEALELLTRIIEERFSTQGALASVLLLDKDGRHLRHGAAPSLPAAYNHAIDGIEIGPAVGSCGTSAYSGQRVMVSDIAGDPLWKDFAALALKHGLRACWSTPLVASGRVVGTMAVYYRQPQDPTREEIEVLERVCRTAAVAIERVRSDGERKQAEASLRESEERFRMMADNISQLAWICDHLGNVTWYNRRWLDYTGLAFEDMKGWDWSKVQHPDHLDRVVAQVRRAAETGEIWEDTFPLRGKDGNYRWFLSRAVPIRDAQGKIGCWFGTNTDVTEQREAAERMSKMEKLAAAGQLAASLSHEINNPLSSVTNALYLLEHHSVMADESRKYVITASRELARVTRIVRQSLSYYRAGAVPKDFDLSQLARESLQLFGPKFEHGGIEVHADLERGARLLGFPDEIRQVIDNLLLNAVDAMVEGGRLSVTVKHSRDWHRPERAGVRMTIADSGCGVPKELRSRLFEPFFTTKHEKGAGLGLWVLRGIIAKHEGSIALRTSDRPRRSGTTISIFLPALAHALQGARGAGAEAESAA